ncbi:MAG: iron-sulfur cluster assembly accessory protein [Rhodobacteraceae bacterium]|nr:iron-sulfur cluster assembly accessory protein [Paracoccaceae bacterium]
MDLYLAPKVTDRAFKKLAEINSASNTSQCLRVAVSGGGCSGFQYEITLDQPQEDDLVLEGHGQSVLIDSLSLPFLDAAEIDYAEELIGSRFVIVNPNATSTCGCSMSFSI